MQIELLKETQRFATLQHPNYRRLQEMLDNPDDFVRVIPPVF